MKRKYAISFLLLFAAFYSAIEGNIAPTIASLGAILTLQLQAIIQPPED